MGICCYARMIEIFLRGGCNESPRDDGFLKVASIFIIVGGNDMVISHASTL